MLSELSAPNVAVFGVMLRACRGQRLTAWLLLERMVRQSVPPNATCLAEVLAAWAHASHAAPAVRLAHRQAWAPDTRSETRITSVVMAALLQDTDSWDQATRVAYGRSLLVPLREELCRPTGQGVKVANIDAAFLKQEAARRYPLACLAASTLSLAAAGSGHAHDGLDAIGLSSTEEKRIVHLTYKPLGKCLDLREAKGTEQLQAVLADCDFGRLLSSQMWVVDRDEGVIRNILHRNKCLFTLQFHELAPFGASSCKPFSTGGIWGFTQQGQLVTLTDGHAASSYCAVPRPGTEENAERELVLQACLSAASPTTQNQWLPVDALAVAGIAAMKRRRPGEAITAEAMRRKAAMKDSAGDLMTLTNLVHIIDTMKSTPEHFWWTVRGMFSALSPDWDKWEEFERFLMHWGDDSAVLGTSIVVNLLSNMAFAGMNFIYGSTGTDLSFFDGKCQLPLQLFTKQQLICDPSPDRRRPGCTFQIPDYFESTKVVSLSDYAASWTAGPMFRSFETLYTAAEAPSWEDGHGQHAVMRMAEKGLAAARAAGLDPNKAAADVGPGTRFAFDLEGLLTVLQEGFYWSTLSHKSYASNGAFGASTLEVMLQAGDRGSDVLSILMFESQLGMHLTVDGSLLVADLTDLERYQPLPGFAPLGGKAVFSVEGTKLKTVRLEYNGTVYDTSQDPLADAMFERSVLKGRLFAEKAIIASLLAKTQLLVHVRTIHMELAPTLQAVTLRALKGFKQHPLRQFLEPFITRNIQATNNNLKLWFEFRAAEFGLAPLSVEEQMKLIAADSEKAPLNLADMDMEHLAEVRGWAALGWTPRWYQRALEVQRLFDTLIREWAQGAFEGDDRDLQQDEGVNQWWEQIFAFMPSLQLAAKGNWLKGTRASRGLDYDTVPGKAQPGSAVVIRCVARAMVALAMGSFLASAECADADGAGPGASPDGGSPDVQQVVSPRQTALDCKQFLREANGRLSDFYERVRDLGEGAFGEVFLARQRICAGSGAERQGRLCAVKRVRKPNVAAGLDEPGADSEEALQEFRVEVELMKSLDHPSICRLLQVYEDPKNLYLVMEHIPGGELFDHVVDRGHLSEHEAARVIRQVASALAYCHQHGVVHRDIKPENILVAAEEEELSVKLIDFGFGSRILEGVKLRAKVGTFVYSAPEILKGDRCDEKLDLWALGCVLFVLVSGDSPFYGEDCQARILEARYEMEGEEWSAVSEQCKSLIRALLQKDPKDRLSAHQVLEHPWLASTAPHLQVDAAALKQIDALEAFHQQNLFRHLAAGVLAKQLDETDLHDLHKAFCEIDADENGVVSFAEFKEVLKDHLERPELEASKVADIFRSVDLDGKGVIDYTEFVAACLDHKVEEEEGVCWAAFQVFDKDCNGVVTFEELEQVLNSASMEGTFSPELRKELWSQLTAGAEDVDFDHFLAALRGVRLPVPTETAKALPLPRRQHGAVGAMGLPIKARGVNEAAPTGLPIKARGANESPPTGLPIKARGVNEAAPAGLPIKARGVNEATPAGLPIKASGVNEAAPAGLPIKARGVNEAAPAGLPIKARGVNEAPLLPIGKK
ncbi:unnamed protein product [Effrenium voratum]|nr:unnamed protein product [Effrenium voratum]